MFSDGVVDLVEAGCITNSQKKILPGKIVGSFCLGSRRLYDFLDNNPFIGIQFRIQIILSRFISRTTLYISFFISHG
jgi:acyl-CoA hydrolase